MRGQIYTPGAGHMPPELSGRDELILSWEVMLTRVQHEGRVGAIDTVLVGLRGVGKSVLLTRLTEIGQSKGFESIRLQGSGTTSVVDSILNEAAERTALGETRWEAARRSLSQITGVSLNIAGVGIGVDREPTTPVGRSHHPEQLAAILAKLAGRIHEELGGGLVLSIDEFQMTRPDDIKLLGGVLNHLNTAHPQAPVVFVAAGLPNLPERMIGPDHDDPYITNPERLFAFETLPLQLSPDAVAVALTRPAERAGSSWEPAAVDAVHAATGGYPAHLQIYAAAAWAHGDGTHPVTGGDVDAVHARAADIIEKQYLEPRWRRLSGQQQAYLTAIAICGDTAPTAAVAAILGSTITSQSSRRNALLRRGEIFESQRGRIQLSMPAMRAYALDRYPATVEADPSLITPKQMMDNLDDWRRTQHAKRAGTTRFPASLIGQTPGSAPDPTHGPAPELALDRTTEAPAGELLAEVDRGDNPAPARAADTHDDADVPADVPTDFAAGGPEDADPKRTARHDAASNTASDTAGDASDDTSG